MAKPPQAAAAPPKESSEIVNLNVLIDKSASVCLNEDSDYPFSNILTPSDAFVLKSDCDE